MEILRAEALDDECTDGDINNDNPCNPMECWDGQWYEIIIDCAEQEGWVCDGGVYVPPAEGECCSECVLYGDINQDGSINVNDVVIAVNIALGMSPFNELADINGDTIINVQDVILLVDIILSN